VADTLLDHIDPAEIENAQKVLGHTESTGQDRMHALHASFRASGRRRDLEIYPHLWAGVGLVRGGAGTAHPGIPRTAIRPEYWFAGAVTPRLACYACQLTSRDSRPCSGTLASRAR
jgi:alkanesulfonate monooxygenase